LKIPLFPCAAPWPPGGFFISMNHGCGAGGAFCAGFRKQVLAFNPQLVKHGMRREELQHALAEVRAVYAELAKRPVTRNCVACTECCQFRLTGLTPQPTKGEALVAAKGFRATGRKVLPESADGACPLLQRATGKCLIYADRPFGCRTHFCAAAGGPYARKEVLDLIRRLEDVDRKLGGAGPRKIQSAVTDALAEIR
jgi:Fe-S-cluster containining protein